MTEKKPTKKASGGRTLTPEEHAFHHKVFSTKLEQTKNNLIELSKSSKGLTLAEKMALEEINFLIASGWDINTPPIYVRPYDPLTHEKKLLAYKNKFKVLSKTELLTELCELQVKLEEATNALEMEGKRFEFLLRFFDKNKLEKISAKNARSDGKKTGKSSIYFAHKEKAIDVIREIKKLKTTDTADKNAWINAEIEPTDFKLFSIKMRAALNPAPKPTTLRNYFLKVTGLSTTK
jgi:hypothetical protein